MAQQNTHTIWFHHGGKRTGWDCPSQDAVEKIYAAMQREGLRHRTKGGTLIVIPWHNVTRVEVKPIRRRGVKQ